MFLTWASLEVFHVLNHYSSLEIPLFPYLCELHDYREYFYYSNVAIVIAMKKLQNYYEE